MAGGITVTPEQLQEISAQLASGAADIEATLARLANIVSPLHSDWVGVAQAQFVELWQQWQTDGTGLHQALEGVSQLTAQASQAYSNTEQQITSTFNQR
jgi:WXG100 family type VII secretion target